MLDAPRNKGDAFSDTVSENVSPETCPTFLGFVCDNRFDALAQTRFFIPPEEKYSTKYANIRERFGNEMTELEIDAAVDQLYCTDPNYTLRLLSKGNMWTTRRHPIHQDRAVLSTELSRKKSVETIGIVAVRKGPSMVEPPPGSDGPFELLEWAHLLRGAELAWCHSVWDKRKGKTYTFE